MLSSLMKNGAVSARTKCMFGKRIKPAQYEAMSAKTAVRDLILYLKAETGYRDVFAGVNENMLHYGQIEALIRRDIFQRYMRLSALTFGPDKGLMDFVFLRAEMAEVLAFIPLLISGRQGEYLCGLPEPMRGRTKIDFSGFAGCGSFEEFLKKLGGTRYQAILRAYAGQRPLDYTRLEADLAAEYYRRQKKIVEGIENAAARRAVSKRLAEQAEIINISRIIRMKKYYAYSPEDTEKNLVKIGRSAETPLIRAMIAAKPDSVDDILAKSKYGGYAKKMSAFSPEKLHYTLMYRSGLRVLYGPAPTAEIVLAYLDLKEIELRNIITVVEGIIHGFSPPQIQDYLVM